MKIRRNTWISFLWGTPGRKAVCGNFFSLSGMTFLTQFLPFLTVPYLLRVIGAEKFGLLSFAQAFMQYFALIIEYGFSLSATREIAIWRNDPEKVNAIASAVLLIRGSFFALALLVLGLLVILVPKFRQDMPIYLMAFSGLTGVVLFPGHIFQGFEKMQYVFWSHLIPLVPTALTFVLVRTKEDYPMVVLLSSAGGAAVGLVGLIWSCTRFKIHYRLPAFGEVRHQLKEGWYIFISSLSVSCHTNVRVFALGLFADHKVTGYFAVAERMMNLFATFPFHVMAQAVYPRLSLIYHESAKRGRELINMMQSLTNWLYLAATPVFFIFAKDISLWVCGEASPEVIISFRWLLIALFFSVANGFRLYAFLIMGHSKIFSKICIICGIVGAILMISSTYFFSWKGAVGATIFMSLFAILITVWEENRPKSYR